MLKSENLLAVRLTPNVASAGPSRAFDVFGINYNAQTRRLVLTCRDGEICLEIQGEWEVVVVPSTRLFAISVDEAVRIHDGSTMVVLSTH